MCCKSGALTRFHSAGNSAPIELYVFRRLHFRDSTTTIICKQHCQHYYLYFSIWGFPRKKKFLPDREGLQRLLHGAACSRGSVEALLRKFTQYIFTFLFASPSHDQGWITLLLPTISHKSQSCWYNKFGQRLLQQILMFQYRFYRRHEGVTKRRHR